MFEWPVVPLCINQLKDVNPIDILNNGLYRKCSTYHSGGGYDKLPYILKGREMFTSDKQFVVQLAGCPFKCPYCYVTPDGVNGKAVKIDTTRLIEDFKDSGQDIFHLMGGAPALYISHWDELIKALENQGCKVFHSDLMLVECEYTNEILHSIESDIAIHAVSVKGCNQVSYIKNTGTKVDLALMKHNLQQLYKSNINYYITFTGMTDLEVKEAVKWLEIKPKQLKDSFTINLIKYKALIK